MFCDVDTIPIQHLHTRSQSMSHTSCGDPESFVRGGPTLTGFLLVLFLVDERKKDPNTTISEQAGNHGPARETPLKWRFTSVPMMAHH